MRPVPRFFVIVFSIFLLIDQSVSFLIEQLHGVSSGAPTLVADQHQTPARESGNTRDASSHCSHGCHFQNHFIAYVMQNGSGLPLSTGAIMALVSPVQRLLSATLETPYRPPRLSPHA